MHQFQTLVFTAICFVTPFAVAKESDSGHAHGPNGGMLVAVGERFVELNVSGGNTVTARILGKDKKPVATDAASLTLTFTEQDGEKEDYEIPARKLDSGAGFQRKSAHLVAHVVRDKMAVKVKLGGKTLISKAFVYPHGPNGGELIALGKSDYLAELVVTEAMVRIHVLNKRKRPAKTDAKTLTLTFTEKDGEVEDYQIARKSTDSPGAVFERKSKHVVKHVKQDKMAVKLDIAGKTLSSKKFNFPPAALGH